MRILFTTHHLVNFAGSELVTLDLVNEFKKRSFDVTVATFMYDYPVKSVFEGNSIEVVNITDEELKQKEYDIIWAQHSPSLYQVLFDNNVTAKRVVSSSLSPYEPLEVPPIFANELSLCIANSEENKEQMIREGVKRDKTLVFLNSVPDHVYHFYDDQKSPELKKIAIVSNHVPLELLNIITLLKQRNIDVDIFGIDYKFEYVTPEKLKGYDAIITIGRTVQLGLAMGIPVYCYDHFGGPGWIRAENVEQAEFFNFSGRCTNRKNDTFTILEEITQYYPVVFKNERKRLFRRAKEKYWLSNNVSSVMAHLEGCSEVSWERIFSKKLVQRHNQYYIRELKNNLYFQEKIGRGFFQVFWNLGEGYCEENSSIKKIYFNDHVQTLEFSLPSEVIGNSVRIDPLNIPGYIEISSIELIGEFNDGILAGCSEDNGFEGLTPINGLFRVKGTGRFLLLSINEDPQLNWEIPTKDFSNDQIRIRIKFRVEKERIEGINNLLSSEIDYLTNNHTLLEMEILDKQKLIDESDNQMRFLRSNLDKKVEELNHSNRVLALTEDDLQSKDNELKQLITELKIIKDELHNKKEELQIRNKELVNVLGELKKITSSTYWEMTAPLRWLTGFNRLEKGVKDE